MAAVVRLELSKPITDAVTFRFQKPNSLLPSSSLKISPRISSSVKLHRRQRSSIVAELKSDADADNPPNNEEDDVGVKVALSMLRFYKREISPLLPNSCRYIPTCSEYSMEAYKRYGVVKGTVLTAWRLCRCNPLGGSGFDPPRWFDEERPPEE